MNNESPTARSRHRPLAAAAAAFTALGAAVTAAVLSCPLAAEAQPAAVVPPGPLGRDQVVAASRERNPHVVLVDTQTGHVWTADVTGGRWDDRGTPPAGELNPPAQR